MVTTLKRLNIVAKLTPTIEMIFCIKLSGQASFAQDPRSSFELTGNRVPDYFSRGARLDMILRPAFPIQNRRGTRPY